MAVSARVAAVSLNLLQRHVVQYTNCYFIVTLPKLK